MVITVMTGITTLAVITAAAETINGRAEAPTLAENCAVTRKDLLKVVGVTRTKTRPHSTGANPTSQEFWNEME